MKNRSADPLFIGMRSIVEQEEWLTKLAAGPRDTSDENALVVAAMRALEALHAYDNQLDIVIQATRVRGRDA